MRKDTRGTARWDVLPFLPLGTRRRDIFVYRSRAREPVAPGVLVAVPFGSRTVEGLVLRAASRVIRGEKTILRVLSPSPLFSAGELRALEILSSLSLEPLSAMAAAATAVRRPGPTRGEEKPPRFSAAPEASRADPPPVRPQDLSNITISWQPLSDALPTEPPRGPVLVLVPENVIGSAVVKTLSDRRIPVVTFAQSLPKHARRNLLARLAAGDPVTVVATHAGLFLPFPPLERIIVAETALAGHRRRNLHPRYDARVGALVLSVLERIPVVFQSTAPSLDLRALERLLGRAPRGPAAPAWTVLARGPAKPLLLPEILNALRETTANGGTAFLFHDSVGGARAFACETCGVLLRCAKCGDPLERATSENRNLACAGCGAPAGSLPLFCSHCRSPHLAPRTIGTAFLSEQLRRALPETVVVRADRTTLPRSPPARAAFRVPRPGIILGTERAFAHLRRADVDLVAVLSLDAVLAEPFFDAEERAAVLLSRLGQLARSDGIRLFGTAHPNLPLARAVARGDLVAWAERAELDRQQLRYPPATAALVLEQNFQEESRAERAVTSLRQVLHRRVPSLHIGSRLAKRRGGSRGLLLLRGDLADLLRALVHLPAKWKLDPLVPLSVVARALVGR